MAQLQMLIAARRLESDNMLSPSITSAVPSS
jgi:hypothetical protein